MPVIPAEDALDILDDPDDIVDELRGGPSKDLVGLRRRAADEIEQLRAKLAVAMGEILSRRHLTK